MPARWWITHFATERDRANWSGNVYALSEARRRLTCLERDFTPAQLLIQCRHCQGGWHPFDRYALCSACQGSGLKPIAASLSDLGDAA